MTAQPYYPPPAPQAYPQAPAPQGYPQQAYPAPPAPQQYAVYPPQAPPQQPAQPLATGSIDDYYSQPTSGGGPSISWKEKPLGTAYAGVVIRDVTNGDIQQQTNFQTKAPEFYKDGRPKFVMKVPLLMQPTAEFPEGEATLFVRGRMRDELVRAMGEAGVTGAPKKGDVIIVTLVDKKASGQGLNPANVFAIQYQPADRAAEPQQAAPPAAPQPAPPAPVQVQAPQVPAAPQPPAQQFPAQPQVQQVAPQPAAPAPVQQQAPSAPVPPAGMTPEQQALLAGLTGGQG